MMKKQKWIFYLSALVILQLMLALPLIADGDNDYSISDIALTPGPDASQLNFTWHTTITIDKDTNIEDIDIDGDPCKMKIAKRLFNFWGVKKLFPFFPPGSRTFEGAWASAGTDENGDTDYYCKVTVDGLDKSGDYAYKLTDGEGKWSDSFDYIARDQKKFGFLYVADPQIGASGPKDISQSQDVKPFIEKYYETNDPPEGYTVDDVYDLFYDEYTNEGRATNLEDLTLVDPILAGQVLDLIAERITEQMEASANDTKGWATTVELMTGMFPKASFIVSGGDQVDLMNAEWEYTGFFTPYKLTSIPVAPTYAGHDKALNFEYHFNLPNESEEYGQDLNGVGDYYFTHGNTLFMVLNMDVTNGLFPGGGPPPDSGSPPPGGGSPPPGGGGSSIDTDEDDISDDDDLCPEIYGESDYHGCRADGDYDGDGVINSNDLCSNTPEGYDVDDDGCPYFDTDSDGIPDEIDRCNNTYGGDNDLWVYVDDDGCADCGYIETDDELRAWLKELANTCETDKDTGETTCELDDFQASLDEHKTFIAKAIAANPQAKWKIVVWHYSIYSAAMHSTDNQAEGIRYLFTPMLEELDIDVVLMGHDHSYTKTYQMLGNEPQLDQMVTPSGKVINPTGIVYLTASSSSGSKYYALNCNIGDDTSSSAEYYEYAAVYYENMPTFTYFEVNDNSLKFKSFSYALDEDTGYYEPILIDEYAMEK